ncbi:hypothetical protein N5A93_08250 [Roseovarius sp. EGI FJ00037]|uniref:hypothetical protein n=1 Tax=Roseovarius salincola TaxID=2978479 RepID=UPI0022A8931E|nr:hypothetical protein [Roseovarius sp. EGI FJ00037]MCZ0812219.1 hypothetical protein [Roseovarius sp. EGI FJ00037]
MDGSAHWTSIGKERGQDPLAMRAPVEFLYRRLLSGFSTVTTRLRYYSFYSWWLTEYSRNGATDSRADYDDWIRRGEALYALASLYNPENPTTSSGERGLSGRDYATRALAQGDEIIDFAYETARSTPKTERYIQRKGGDFSQVYAPQMRDIGLLDLREKQKFMVPTKQGRALAQAFADSVGAAGSAFLAAAKDRRVDRATLTQIAILRPSAIGDDTEEAVALRDLLLGRDLEADFHAARRKTLHLILQEADRETDRELSQDSLRWSWMETIPDDNSPLGQTHASWRHFQAGDTARIVCELLLRAGLDHLARPAGSRTLPELAGRIVADAPEISLEAYLVKLEDANTGISLEAVQARACDGTAILDDILSPLARLWRIWGQDPSPLLDDYLPQPHRQTVATILQWIARERNTSAATALALFCKDFVLRRHLFIAARKLHGGRYTYLFEFEEGRLFFRNSFAVSEAGPRLKTAQMFLDDAGLICKKKLTDLGRAELEAA